MRAVLLLTLIVSIVFGPALCCCTASQVPTCCAEKKPAQEPKQAPAVPSCCQDHSEDAPATPDSPPLHHPKCLCHVERASATLPEASVAVDPPTFFDWLTVSHNAQPASPCQIDKAAPFHWPGGDTATFVLDFCHILRC